MSDYNYLSVTENEKFLEAYLSVMDNLIDQTVGMEMAEVSIFPENKWASNARRICAKNPEIHNLVNNEIEKRQQKLTDY